jgi:2-alkenal reductase
MNLKSDQRGVLVNQVTAGSPAAQAGLQGGNNQITIDGEQVPKGGDVIITVDNQPVKNFDDLVIYLARSTEVGQTVTLTILRNGQQQDVKVTLAARPASTAQTTTNTAPSTNRGNTTGRPWLGIQGLDLTSDLANAMNLSANQSGVLIDQVQPNSPAEQAGLQGGSKIVTLNGQDVRVGGDVIVAIDGQSVTGMNDLLAQLQQDKVGQKVTLTILRNGKQQDVTVTLTARPTALP